MSSGLSAFVEQHRGELSRFLASRCGDAALAEDLLQDLWIKASSQAPGPVANPRAYLFRMANNLMLDHLRARQRAMVRDREWIESDGAGSGPGSGEAEDRADPSLPADEAIAREQEAELVRAAISQLPPGARGAFQLCRIEGRKLEEAAAILGISRSGVEKHLAVAMKNLRASLADCGLIGSAASSRHRTTPGTGTPMEHER